MHHKISLSDEFRQMIAHLHRGGTFGYYHMLPARESYWWPAGRPDDLLVNRGEHVYFGVHPTDRIPPENASGKVVDPKYVRGQKKYIAAVNCLIAEFDPKQFGDLAGIIAHVKSLPFQPSIQILSGSGLHAYYLLRDPFIISNDKKRKYITRIHREWSITVKGDASKDTTRVLRVPGSLNWKHSPPSLVMMLDWRMDVQYDLDELSSILPPPFDPPSSHTPGNDVLGWRSNTSDPISDFNSSVKVSDLLQRYGYIWHGTNRMMSPSSSTKSAGVTVDDIGNRVYVHHESDPLNTGYWARPFDILKMLEFNGDWKTAKDSLQGSI